MRQLSKRARILPYSVPFIIPGFESMHREGDYTLAPAQISCGEWFVSFRERVLSAVGNCYLPVCRMSDGEFRFLLGSQLPSSRESVSQILRGSLRYLIGKAGVDGSGFSAATRRGVSSGDFSRLEWREARPQYGSMLRLLAQKGILAIHLSYGDGWPFQERYLPALGRWLQTNCVVLTLQNCASFYFVYALLTDAASSELYHGRRILVVHGAQGGKRERITEALLSRRARSVEWLAISSNRSFYDMIDPLPYIGQVDLCLVGAGIGKPNILLQLEQLCVPCIDAGYFFELLANPASAHDRPFCSKMPDLDQFGGSLIGQR